MTPLPDRLDRAVITGWVVLSRGDGMGDVMVGRYPGRSMEFGHMGGLGGGGQKSPKNPKKGAQNRPLQEQPY